MIRENRTWLFVLFSMVFHRMLRNDCAGIDNPGIYSGLFR
jgi:hypothetical protein